KRIALWPAESIEACKRSVYASIDLPIQEALKEEAYWLYQATSKTPAIKRFAWADEQEAQFDMDNQRAWEQLVVNVQDVQ
ncbi:MAG: enoyl-CoA hydratase/isomerase family protein, partial [Cyanobacteria bacterium P01_F01_bin.153]